MQVFISVDEARSIILSNVPVQPEEKVPLDEALNKTLASDVVSREAIPPFPNSAMDGYAVRSDDFTVLPVTLEVTGEIPAGAVPSSKVEPGTCIKIMTGAPMPDGADAVVPIEWLVDERSKNVVFDRSPEAGNNVRKAGKDVKSGECVIRRGKKITPPFIGMLATLGYDTIDVKMPPRTAVIATGDELVEPGEPLKPGKIRNSSGVALRAQVEDAGGDPLPPLLARDKEDSIRRAIEKGMEGDILVFAGGVSVGDYDLVKKVLDASGMELLFWKVKQRPGKPLAFGLLNGKPVFGLPGNPVSSAICFDQFVRPAIARMLGRDELFRARFPAILERDTPKVKGLHFFTRGIVRNDEEGRLHVGDTGPQGSNLYSSMLKANCIIHLEEELESAKAGDSVEIERLTWE